MSVRFRIMLADMSLLLLGAGAVTFYIWIAVDGGWKDFQRDWNDGVVVLGGYFVSFVIFLAALIALGKGLGRLFVPRLNPALRAIDRVGPRALTLARLNTEMATASIPSDKFRLSEHWLVFFGKLSIRIVHLDDLVLICVRERKAEHKELVLCDRYGTETAFGLDGFEITRLKEALRKARPSIQFDDVRKVWEKWRADPRTFNTDRQSVPRSPDELHP